MPLTKRNIEPIHVSRVDVAPNVRNELECVTNNTLANVIRELSSLSKHAEDMFYELSQEANAVFSRAHQLTMRIEHVRDKVTQLNAAVDIVSLANIHSIKPFKSTIIKEQQGLSRSTIPRSILEMHQKCDRPPPLEKLNVFREDGKDSMAFYTDPGFFLNLWCLEMDKEIKEKKSELVKKRKDKRKPHATPRQIREPKSKKEIWDKQKDGKEFVEIPDEHPKAKQQEESRDYSNSDHRQSNRPETLLVNNSQINSTAQMDRASMANHYPHHVQPTTVATAAQPVGNRSSNTQMNGPYSQHIIPDHVEPSVPHPEQMAYTGIHHMPGKVSSPQNRPSQPPPAPPPGVRQSLPPPPPPPPIPDSVEEAIPPMGQIHQQRSNQIFNDVEMTGSPVRGPVSQRNSPARQPTYTQRAVSDTSELPSPPPSPTSNHTPDTPGSHNSLPPPPSPPPPFMNIKAPSPPPPPPPLMNGTLPNPSDSTSISSGGSTVTSNSTVETVKPKAVDERNDLLAEIRKGDWNKKLRRVENRKEEQKRTPAGRIDVQAMMDRAIELRRKVIEESDDDMVDNDSDNDWDTD